MCATCGCGEGEVTVSGPGGDAHGHEHVHILPDGTRVVHSHGDGGHAHAHAHAHEQGAEGERRHVNVRIPKGVMRDVVRIERDILEKNDRLAADNRRDLLRRGIFALNLVSSPGSGKTTLLVRTLRELSGRVAASVIEGDQQTDNDAERIRATGAPAIQINTGKGCHLDAQMVANALGELRPPDVSLLFIENVGNLVCPSSFDLGEAHKVVVLSVTEGEDKPLKYPDMFRAADLLLLNKCDLLPYLSFDVDKALECARRVHPGLAAIQISATSGQGFPEWLAWLESGLARARRT